MYIITTNNIVVDYDANGYLCLGSTVICESKGCIFENATITDIGSTSLPDDIDICTYEYILGEFIRKEEVVKVLPIENGGTGVSSMVATDYTINRPRGIILQASEPDSVPNGCIIAVYE